MDGSGSALTLEVSKYSLDLNIDRKKIYNKSRLKV